MEFAVGKKYAERLVEWLGPFQERVEIVGSIRRRSARVNDIDVVLIPKVTEERDLMGEVVGRRNHCLEFLQGYVRENNPHGGKVGTHPYFISGGEKEGKQVMLWLPKAGCQLDLWFADVGTWWTRLVCRTGSVFHNRWMCDRAALRGLHWQPYEGLFKCIVKSEECRVDEGVRHAKVAEVMESEADFYRLLGLGFIEPRDREVEWIERNLEFGLEGV